MPERGRRVADLLDRVMKEMTDRVHELRPFVDEQQRLETALRALGQAGASLSDTGARIPASRRRSRSAPGRPARQPRKRARRGANREALLRAIRDRPGASSAELAGASGVERNTLNGLLGRLVKAGELEKRQLPSGRTGYAMSSTSAD
jgi:hypothetical protein